MPLIHPLANVSPCQRVPSPLTGDQRRASGLQLRETDVQERPAFGGEDAGVPIRRELHAIALGELGALDGVSAMQEH